LKNIFQLGSFNDSAEKEKHPDMERKHMHLNPNLKNIGDVLRRNAQRYPDREGIVSGDERLTWSALNRRVNRLAHGLLSAGIQKGDRIAIVLLNCHQWFEIKFAIHKIGAVFVPVNYRLSLEEVAMIVKDSAARVLFYSEAFTAIVRNLPDQCESIEQMVCVGKPADGHTAYDQMFDNMTETEPDVRIEPKDLAYIAYTGGTTGIPKGAMWRHETVLFAIQDIPYVYELAFQSTELIPVPSFAGGVIVQALNAVYCATTIVFMDFDPLRILQAIEAEKVELMASAVVPLTMLASHPESGKYDVSSLKRIFYGGGSMSLEQLETIRKVFSCELMQGYGSTETLLNVTQLSQYHHLLENEENLSRITSAGRVNKGVELRLADENDKDVLLGEVGEIVVKSKSLFTGYWNRTEETKKALKDGWHYTSDMAYADEEGFVFIVDRKNDMIKTGGLSVYPAEVETVLKTHPDVADAAVVSAPDEKWGEKVVAVVVPKYGDGLTEEAIKQYCRENIGGFKVPKQVDFREKPLPRTALGKLDRKELRQDYWQGHGRKSVL
jgi:acyl-CoA synthetase (AMP-forming)/AMP-acid ligase II